MRALIFDLDGTLVDTVYAHVLAWQSAFAELGVTIEAWQIHRRIGMAREVFTRELATDAGSSLTPKEVQSLGRRHAELFEVFLTERRPLPGAVELLEFLRANRILHGIATSSFAPSATCCACPDLIATC
jgi:beta-phosphoglucomutase-like phosphatase (HAD superfamily)